MATTKFPPTTEIWTYERYMDTPIEGRFEIIEGVLYKMPTPVVKHQIVVRNLLFEFTLYERMKRDGITIPAPSDILIRRRPRLRTRQPDLYYISLERLRAGGGIPEKGPVEVAPELVVEIISDSETEVLVEGKTQDYIAIGVREMWRVWPATKTVEVVELAAEGAKIVATYGEGETVTSRVFPDLNVAVEAIFAVPSVE